MIYELRVRQTCPIGTEVGTIGVVEGGRLGKPLCLTGRLGFLLVLAAKITFISLITKLFCKFCRVLPFLLP